MNHEKLDCYRELVDVSRKIGRLIRCWPRGYSYLADQMTRAIASAVLNLAEGNGKRTSSKERRRFFQISMGSMAEVASGLDLAQAFGLIRLEDINELKSRLEASYNMVRKLP